MGTYSFEGVMTVCDTIDIEAESYQEALEMAQSEFDGDYYAVMPAGFSIPWDNVDVSCVSEPEDEDD